MNKKQESKKTSDKNPHSELLSRIYRSEINRVIGGVAGGIGEYFRIDPTIVRLIFVFLAFLGGSGLIMYLILWAIVPSKSQIMDNSKDAIRANMEEMRLKAKESTTSLRSYSDNNRSLWAILLVILGVVFLTNNFGIFNLDIGKLWPLLLIILGLFLLRRR